MYEKQRQVFKHFDTLRGQRDPSADQLSNIDILIRTFEDACAEKKDGGGFDDDKAGLQLHIQLSRLWIFGIYEAIRRVHEVALKSSERTEICRSAKVLIKQRGTTKERSSGCGLISCFCCKVGHLKNDLAVVRIPMTKQDDANDVLVPPLPTDFRDRLMKMAEPPLPPRREFLVDGEAMLPSGSMAWVRLDKRIGRNRLFARRALSDQIVSYLD